MGKGEVKARAPPLALGEETEGGDEETILTFIIPPTFTLLARPDHRIRKCKPLTLCRDTLTHSLSHLDRIQACMTLQ